MVKRGIGAVVLAIIAALLLGYLLKDKSRERQEVVMNIPGTTNGTTNERIPRLSDTNDNATLSTNNGTADLANADGNTTDRAGATVVAAATGADEAVTDTATTATQTVKPAAAPSAPETGTAVTAMRPGFSIRPAAPGEQRGVIDGGAPVVGAQPDNAVNTGNTGKSHVNRAKQARLANNNAANAAKKHTVVANASGASDRAYKPRLIKERKTRIVSASHGSDYAGSSARPKRQTPAPAKVHAAKHASTTKNVAKKAKPATSSSLPKGSYAIQLMATSSQSRANKLAATMRREGYQVVVTRTTKNNKVLYRVRVKAGATRSAAIKAQQKMKRRYKKNFFVQNSLVVAN